MILRDERRSVYRAVVMSKYQINPNMEYMVPTIAYLENNKVMEYMVPTIAYLENNKVNVDVNKLFNNQPIAAFSIEELLLSCYGENALPLKEALKAISNTFATRPSPYWHALDFTWSTDYFEEVQVDRLDTKLLQNLI